MSYYVYILRSQKSGKTYVGQTSNLEQRLQAHNTGMSPYTKGRGPWEIVFFEEFKTRSEAMQREKYFKTGKGRTFIKEILEKGKSG